MQKWSIDMKKKPELLCPAGDMEKLKMLSSLRKLEIMALTDLFWKMN